MQFCIASSLLRRKEHHAQHCLCAKARTICVQQHSYLQEGKRWCQCPMIANHWLHNHTCYRPWVAFKLPLHRRDIIVGCNQRVSCTIHPKTLHLQRLISMHCAMAQGWLEACQRTILSQYQLLAELTLYTGRHAISILQLLSDYSISLEGISMAMVAWNQSQQAQQSR